MVKFAIITLGLGCVLTGTHAVAETATKKSAKSSRASGASQSTSYSGEQAAVLEKLDEVLANQEKILAKFDAVMEELRIIKVRTLISGGGGSNP